MSNKMKELLQEQTTADQADNSNLKNGVTTSTPNWEREQIPGTPFWIIGNEEQGYNVIMGKWKLSPTTLTSKNKCRLWLQQEQWSTILSMIICVTTDINNQKQN